MKRILIVYGTTDGHTAKVARFLGETLRAEGARPDVVRAAGPASPPAPAGYDGVLVAASVHLGGYQRTLRAWVKANAAALAERPSAFVSVCLGVLQDDARVRADLAAIRERFIRETGWTPVESKSIAGALRYSRYNWLTRWMMRRIVRRAGVETDPNRDYEYTDWDDLRAFAVRFLDGVHRALPPRELSTAAQRPRAARAGSARAPGR